jgi:hypothetical protein
MMELIYEDWVSRDRHIGAGAVPVVYVVWRG